MIGADILFLAMTQYVLGSVNSLSIVYRELKGKGKAIPLQALTGPEGSRRLRLSDFKTIGT
jgi:hypothetical protein